MPKPADRAIADRNLKLAIGVVAKSMGHTPAVCRSNYLDPKKLEAYTAGLK